MLNICDPCAICTSTSEYRSDVRASILFFLTSLYITEQLFRLFVLKLPNDFNRNATLSLWSGHQIVNIIGIVFVFENVWLLARIPNSCRRFCLQPARSAFSVVLFGPDANNDLLPILHAAPRASHAALPMWTSKVCPRTLLWRPPPDLFLQLHTRSPSLYLLYFSSHYPLSKLPLLGNSYVFISM